MRVYQEMYNGKIEMQNHTTSVFNVLADVTNSVTCCVTELGVRRSPRRQTLRLLVSFRQCACSPLSIYTVFDKMFLSKSFFNCGKFVRCIRCIVQN